MCSYCELLQFRRFVALHVQVSTVLQGFAPENNNVRNTEEAV